MGYIINKFVFVCCTTFFWILSALMNGLFLHKLSPECILVFLKFLNIFILITVVFTYFDLLYDFIVNVLLFFVSTIFSKFLSQECIFFCFFRFLHCWPLDVYKLRQFLCNSKSIETVLLLLGFLTLVIFLLYLSAIRGCKIHVGCITI